MAHAVNIYKDIVARPERQRALEEALHMQLNGNGKKMAIAYQDMKGKIPNIVLLIGYASEAGVFPRETPNRSELVERKLEFLRRLDVGGIVCCSADSAAEFNRPETGIEYLFVPIKDNGDTPETHKILKYSIFHVYMFVNEMHKKGKNVLFHCDSGESRSVTVLTATMMTLGMTGINAFTRILNVWPFANTEMGSWLRQYEHGYDSDSPTEFVSFLVDGQIVIERKQMQSYAGGGAAATGLTANRERQINLLPLEFLKESYRNEMRRESGIEPPAVRRPILPTNEQLVQQRILPANVQPAVQRCVPKMPMVMPSYGVRTPSVRPLMPTATDAGYFRRASVVRMGNTVDGTVVGGRMAMNREPITDVVLAVVVESSLI